MLILLSPREHLFGNTGTNHNLFGKGDNVMKIPKRHLETAKKHLKLEHFFFVFKEIEHQRSRAPKIFLQYLYFAVYHYVKICFWCTTADVPIFFKIHRNIGKRL